MEKYKEQEKRTVLDLLERTAGLYEERIAVEEREEHITYGMLLDQAKRTGSFLLERMETRGPVMIFMEKSVETLTGLLGTAYSGNFYVPVQPDQPDARVRQILEVLDTQVILTLPEHAQRLRNLGFGGKIFFAGEAKKTCICEETLQNVRKKLCGEDLLYGIFTSGSTGTPKCIVVSHGAVFDFIGHFTETMQMNDMDVIGNQAPFDFDVSVKDIYGALAVGAKLVLIPKEYFMSPPVLLDYLEEKKVSTLIWAVSALCVVTTLHGLEYKVPRYLSKIMFSGEAMPARHLQVWREKLPAVQYTNLYGPTEITCNCTYYKIPKSNTPELPERLPLGNVFPGRQVFLVDEDGQIIREKNKDGEIVVAGESLAEGYYHNAEATRQAFVHRRGINGELERTYRTGDMAYYNEENMLIFRGRKDFQIKCMGHRIELEEIERFMERVPEVVRACCVFDKETNRIFAFYIGTVSRKTVKDYLKKNLPSFMVPGKFREIEEMPLSKNGKIDRGKLWKNYGE